MWEQEGFDWIAQGDLLCSCKHQQDRPFLSQWGHTPPCNAAAVVRGVVMASWCDFRPVNHPYPKLLLISPVCCIIWSSTSCFFLLHHMLHCIIMPVLWPLMSLMMHLYTKSSSVNRRGRTLNDWPVTNSIICIITSFTEDQSVTDRPALISQLFH